MSAPLRIAVVGVGHLGQHHARLLAAMDDVRLVGDRRHQTGPGRGDRIEVWCRGFTTFATCHSTGSTR